MKTVERRRRRRWRGGGGEWVVRVVVVATAARGGTPDEQHEQQRQDAGCPSFIMLPVAGPVFPKPMRKVIPGSGHLDGGRSLCMPHVHVSS